MGNANTDPTKSVKSFHLKTTEEQERARQVFRHVLQDKCIYRLCVFVKSVHELERRYNALVLYCYRDVDETGFVQFQNMDELIDFVHSVTDRKFVIDKAGHNNYNRFNPNTMASIQFVY